MNLQYKKSDWVKVISRTALTPHKIKTASEIGVVFEVENIECVLGYYILRSDSGESAWAQDVELFDMTSTEDFRKHVMPL